MNDVLISLIRTYVPTLVGGLLGWLVSLGVDVPALTHEQLSGALVGLGVATYYTLARAAEARWPWLGVLLGAPRQPLYEHRDGGRYHPGVHAGPDL